MKILVGIGTCDKFDYCEEELFKRLEMQTFQNFDTLIVDNSEDQFYSTQLTLKYKNAKVFHLKRPKYFRDAVAQARSFITEYASVNNYDYLIFIDADFLIDENTILRLILPKKDFMTAAIGYMHKPLTTCFVQHPFKTESKIEGLPAMIGLPYEFIDKTDMKMIKIVACGLSCCCLSRKAFENYKFEASHEKNQFMEDIMFCRDAAKKGIEIWLDPKLRPIHLHRLLPERVFREGFKPKFIDTGIVPKY
jgi:glycosyltransferase involved in cell wall biosynthesis